MRRSIGLNSSRGTKLHRELAVNDLGLLIGEQAVLLEDAENTRERYIWPYGRSKLPGDKVVVSRLELTLWDLSI